jgi:hypothetical protein
MVIPRVFVVLRLMTSSNLTRRLERKLGGPRALKDAVDVAGDVATHVCVVEPVGQIRPLQQRARDRQAEGLDGLQVYDEPRIVGLDLTNQPMRNQPMKSRTIRLNLSGFSMNMK